ncbi:ABC transporter permease [Gorillibacterium timonense]|uniref:ABC transporter permease n=1 Tax=Gorillibacterium timonense TaxID=1689269 RepID=UPI00071CD4AF|nr:ABC transporter permease [Gorillibacterium timonense]
MRVYGRVLTSEWRKLGKSSIWLLVLVGPLLSTLLGSLDLEGVANENEKWLGLFLNMASGQGLLFLPLFTGIFAAFVCRYEHLDGGWKQLMALPVRRTAVYFAKLTLVLILVAAMQLLFLGFYLGGGKLLGLSLGSLPWQTVLGGIGGGLLGALPIAALQLAVSVGWTSFAGPLSLNVMLTIPNVLVVNSKDFSPWYPWAQPFMAMMPRIAGHETFAALNLSLSTVLIVIAGGTILFLASGLFYFNRKEM